MYWFYLNIFASGNFQIEEEQAVNIISHQVLSVRDKPQQLMLKVNPSVYYAACLNMHTYSRVFYMRTNYLKQGLR